MTVFVDTNIIVRHLVGDPPQQAERATRFLGEQRQLFLADLVMAEVVNVLQSFYEVERTQIATLMRSALSLPSIHTRNPPLLLRTLQIYEEHRLDFADAYLVAGAEMTESSSVASFDKGIDRIDTVERVEPQ